MRQLTINLWNYKLLLPDFSKAVAIYGKYHKDAYTLYSSNHLNLFNRLSKNRQTAHTHK